MAFQQDKKVKQESDEQLLEKGLVRPNSKVWVIFKGSKFHGKPNHVEEIHPALAEKLVEQGKAEYRESGKLTKDEVEENKAAAKKAVVEKGRKPGETKAEKNATDDFDEEDGPTTLNTKDSVKKAGK